ncbi:hypothetical protein HELRODRAFT_168865 [Helobdella robusta]|uniref:Uncharacterized protein n=1 Tax=Helobdella robusta TaxID=6412 RepID=T1F125_HELRO|nr:hypothetical protein HELRODRAFT_168865 [Helobdella robusta]ESO08944.1 hypothetical protein HELRODRAFT_168865 [Helobdella robusta]
MEFTEYKMILQAENFISKPVIACGMPGSSDNLNIPFLLAMWNARTFYQTGKLERVKQEMKRMNTDKIQTFCGHFTFDFLKFYLDFTNNCVTITVTIEKLTPVTFLDHIMRKEKMENLTTTGKIAEKRDRGQQRTTFVKSLCHLLNITTFQLLQSVEDRVLWRSMVANVLKG